MKLCIKLCSLLLLITESVCAQKSPVDFPADTVAITILDAEQRFVNQSLSVLAANYNIEISKATILQAKQWYNPNIAYAQQMYAPGANKQFDNSKSTGQVDVQVHQLISIAGKRLNSVKLAKIDAQKTHYSFDELLLTLKYELYSNYSDVLAAQQKLKLYAFEDANLTLLINAAGKEVSLGALAGNELVRLRVEQQNLRNESLSVEGNLFEAEKNLKQLLNFSYSTFIVAKEPIVNDSDLPTIATVLSSAQQNRPDLLMAQTEVRYQSQNLKLQKSTAVPDLTLGAEYDRRSNYLQNYYGIGAAIDLPVFNHNQGNIRVARLQLEQARVLDTLQINLVQNEVTSAYLTLFKIKTQLNAFDENYITSVENLAENALSNYQKKYISLLEFLDQLRTYKDAKFGIIDLQSDYFKAIQNLNYTAGSTIIK